MERKNIFKKLINNKEELQDLGFSTKVTNRQRAINKDGHFNVVRKSSLLRNASDTYTDLITMPWWKFNLLVLGYYLAANILFALAYYALGVHFIRGVEGNDFEKFMDVFFFSAQTLTTVGYGYMSPKGILAGSVAAAESMIGLLGFALATGILYGRFSRPVARVLYSKNLLLSPYKQGKALMFKIANARKNELIEVEVDAVIAINVQEETQSVRRFYNLELERRKVNFFPLTWTIVHAIDEKSPIKEMQIADLESGDAEILIYLKGFDDTYAQNVHSRYSYTPDEVVDSAKFTNIITQTQHGTVIELDRLNEYELV